jgi:hypothetical protein
MSASSRVRYLGASTASQFARRLGLIQHLCRRDECHLGTSFHRHPDHQHQHPPIDRRLHHPQKMKIGTVAHQAISQMRRDDQGAWNRTSAAKRTSDDENASWEQLLRSHLKEDGPFDAQALWLAIDGGWTDEGIESLEDGASLVFCVLLTAGWLVAQPQPHLRGPAPAVQLLSNRGLPRSTEQAQSLPVERVPARSSNSVIVQDIDPGLATEHEIAPRSHAKVGL